MKESNIPIKPANSKFNDEQWQAIHHTGNNILIAASAGSGKTTVLIERIMNHLQTQYTQLENLLVVTFTEAAANEMKERMEVRLKKAINNSNDTHHRAVLLEQLNQLPSAQIRTLHSFCLQVIQKFFYLLDLNPDQHLITDNSQMELIYTNVWKQLIEQIYEEKIEDLTISDYQDLLSCFSNGREDQGLRQLILEIYHFALSNPEPQLWIDKITKEHFELGDFWTSQLYKNSIQKQLASSLNIAYQSLVSANDILLTCSQACFEKYHTLLNTELEITQELFELLKNQDMALFIDQIQSINFKRWPSNRAKALEEDLEMIEEMKNLRDNSKLYLQNIQKLFPFPYQDSEQIETSLFPILQRLKKIISIFHEQLLAYKRKENLIDYTDLEHITLDILAPYHPEEGQRIPSPAALYYQDLFTEVLVDEYQDINEIQASILSWLSREKDSKRAGNLFMVGDVKQSIYGFRMAEPSLFLEKYELYQHSNQGDLIILDKNYRSRNEVLNFVNYLFERLMNKDFGEMDYGPKEALKYGNSEFENNSSEQSYHLELLLYDKSESHDDKEENIPNSYSIKKSLEAEAMIIAQDIQKKIETNYLIYDKDTQNYRPITFKDIVILSATRSAFSPLQTAFDYYQIPFVSQAIERYFQRQEIQLLLALLRIIDNPIQDIPLVAVLRSFFVGLSDEELSHIRIHQPNGDFYHATINFLEAYESGNYQAETDLYHKLYHFKERVDKWRQYARKHAIDEVVWLIYQETAFLDYVGGLDNGIQRQANLHAFYQKARNLAAHNQESKNIAGFIEYIDQLIKQEKDLAEPIILDDNQNAVRAMTIHASKGSEFPLVYLINTGRNFKRRQGVQAIIPTKHYGIGVNYYNTNYQIEYPSISKKARQILKEKQNQAEQMRLLYVALTRSEQKIIIVATIDSREKWENMMDQTKKETDPDELLINLAHRSSSDNYLTWIGQALSLYQRKLPAIAQLEDESFSIQFFSINDINDGLIINREETSDPDKWLEKLLTSKQDNKSLQHPIIKRLRKLQHAQYPYQFASQTASYQSVSELKRLYEEPHHQALSFYQDRSKGETQQSESYQGIQAVRYTQNTFEDPSFLQEKRYDAAKIGILNHYFMQELDFGRFNHVSQENYLKVLKEEIKRMITEGKITDKDCQFIQLEKIVTFLIDPLGQTVIQNAPHLFREQAFSYLIKATDIFTHIGDHLSLEEDSVLIHGVIDNYFIIENQGFILIDFKTDRYRQYANKSKAEQIEGLKNKYRYQLSLYNQALQSHLQLPNLGTYIVAIDYQEVVKIEELVHFK
ncbi:helicase-exonuclease AddAB subunit AddA [Facklamia sp. DSM 111018]|uniref:DNA 3'-5' helicase n=1 Tax=Facklamia lactis TaxID=2749967 RepID=A0ABS0LMS7_9LACT|nr:helicase-exonuclease AddAB subunit AddA [Facklamia lactis]MBG9979867.1 helicase-exonuclease AddAB subunit AddA [Facklamia lactis]MBG9985453.1 helicase-exonuclease AddAB subunit AddA [Facklamia lactis]